jgi:inorganic triphosphatase YgiF
MYKMPTPAGEELEVKLELTPPEMQRIGSHPALEALTVGKPETRTLRSLYFDTPDHQLRAHGISLRLRSSEQDPWVQTVKAGNGVGLGVFSRAEFEAPIATPEPDLQAISDRKLRRKITEASMRSALEPVFETVVKRTTRRLHADNAELELALDEGVIRAGKQEGELCEAELELKAGSPASLLEVATTLFASESLRLAHTSKAERGYNLLLGRRDESVLPLRASHPTLEGDESCAEALTLFLQSANSQLVANRRVVLETDDPEGAHQLRIGLRRLRSALRAFRPLDGTSVLREIEMQARSLAASIGRLRDADVLIEDILAPVAGRLKGEPGVADLRECLSAYRVKVRDEVRRDLAQGPWSKLQLYLALWPRTFADNAMLRSPVREFATPALNKGWKRLAKLGAGIEALTLDERHEMRKALKAFRYTSEFFASLHEKRDVARFAKQLRKLQDIFGYINDVVVAKRLTPIARESCPTRLEAQRAAGYVLGWHDAQAAHAWSAAPKEWRRLQKRSRYWG